MDKITKDVLNETSKMVDEFGARLAGTKPSLDAADYLYNDGLNYSDLMFKEDFKVHKGAFFGWINLLVIFYIVGIISFVLKNYYITAFTGILSLVILYFQFIKYLPVIDFLFPKKTARNVYGIIEPKGEVKRQIIISGHHDSAPIFNFFVNQPKLYGLRVTGSIIFVVLSLVIGLLNIFVKNELVNLISLIVLGIGFLLVGQMWFFKNKKGTPGAGDNLASTQVAFQLGKYFYNLKGTDDELQNTRIIFASFDAEEEGLRGARAFVKAHENQLQVTKTYVLNIECLYDNSSLFFLTSDINNSVKLSDSLADDLISEANKLNVKTHKQNIAVLTGGTDAGEFGKINVEATTIIGMPWSNDNRNMAYHTLNDTVDAVDELAVLNTLKIFKNYIVSKDKE